MSSQIQTSQNHEKLESQEIKNPSETQSNNPEIESASKIQDYQKLAERVALDPNIEAADNIRTLEGSKSRMEQLDGLSALSTALTSLVAKITKKDSFQATKHSIYFKISLEITIF